MEDLSNFKNLHSIPGFDTLRKMICSSKGAQRQDHINQLNVTKALSEMPGLELIGIEQDNPPKDIKLEYKKTGYAAEVKTIHESKTKYGLKKIIDKIFVDSYSRLDKNYCNIIFIISETSGCDEVSIQDACVEVFRRHEDKEYAKRQKLNAIVFREVASPPNYIWDNPKMNKIDNELKSFILDVDLKRYTNKNFEKLCEKNTL